MSLRVWLVLSTSTRHSLRLLRGHLASLSLRFFSCGICRLKVVLVSPRTSPDLVHLCTLARCNQAISLHDQVGLLHRDDGRLTDALNLVDEGLD